jgi:hypothetical protein
MVLAGFGLCSVLVHYTRTCTLRIRHTHDDQFIRVVMEGYETGMVWIWLWLFLYIRDLECKIRLVEKL